MRQFKEHTFKLEGGESFEQVFERYHNALNNILTKNKGETILISSHSTAILMALTKWCKYDINKLEFTYNDKKILDGKIETLEIFKLIFENDNLIDIINLRIEGLYKI